MYKNIFFVVTAFTTLCSPAFAASSGKGESHRLSASGGISAPAQSTAVFQNPAGLVYEDKLMVTTHAWLPANSLDAIGVGGGLLYGNGDFGVAGGIRTPVKGAAGSTSLFYGLGVNISSINTAFGLSGFTALSGGGTSFNGGALIQPNKQLRIGFTVINLAHLVEFGAGLAYEFTDGISFVLDATIDDNLNHPAVQPGILIAGSRAALTVSYGFGLHSRGGGGTSSAQLTDGLGLGGSVELGSSVSWQLYYQQLAKYYTALTFDL